MNPKPPRLLIIAGSDSGGGAGVQAGVKTACAFGVYAMTAVTAVTVQDTKGVRAVYPLPPKLVRNQIAACLDDIGADAIATGMLASADIAAAVAGALRKYAAQIPVVLDPVLRSTGGKRLLEKNAIGVLKSKLLPLAALVTPNLPEARALVGLQSAQRKDVEAAARKLIGLGARAALIKGGHATDETIDDVLVWEGGVDTFGFPRIRTNRTHGTGCTLAAAIACGLAQGNSPPVAVGRAREFVQHAIDTAPDLGQGHGPLNFLADRALRSAI